MQSLLKFAACYLRVSTDEQTEFSPDAQLTAIREYAKRNGYILLDQYIFKDEGISGRKAEKRPAFMRMIAAAKEKPAPFETILVHKIDRFARSREDSVVYKSLLRKECGVKVISITENIEDDKFSVILEAMLEAMAEYYSLNLSEEVKKGMTEKAKRGGLQTKPSFGYTAKDNVLVPVPKEAAFVKSIFERFIAGEGCFTIARWLNNMGVKTRHGNNFDKVTVEYIIRNPVYISKLRWNPSGKTPRGHYDDPNIILVDGKHEPIIDIETWDAAQSRVEENKARAYKHMRPRSEHRDWLTGIVKCSECGKNMAKTYRNYWKCGAFNRGSCKTSQHVSDEKIKRMIKESLFKEISSTYRLDYVSVHTKSQTLSEYEMINAQLKRTDIKLEKIKAAYYHGADTLEEYKAAKSIIDTERASLNEQLAALVKDTDDIDYSANIRMSLQMLVDKLYSDNCPMEEKNFWAHEIIKEISYNKAANSLKFIYYHNITLY